MKPSLPLYLLPLWEGLEAQFGKAIPAKAILGKYTSKDLNSPEITVHVPSFAQCNIDLLCFTLLFYQLQRSLHKNHNRKAIYIHCKPLASNPNSHHSLLLKYELLVS